MTRERRGDRNGERDTHEWFEEITINGECYWKNDGVLRRKKKMDTSEEAKRTWRGKELKERKKERERDR